MDEARRRIVHLDVPDFCTVLEESRNPEWKQRPLVLTGSGTRAVIQGVNTVARTEGLREGMPLEHARRLCRRLHAIAPDGLWYRQCHQSVLELLNRFSPQVEGPIPGRYFVDVTGTECLWGAADDLACRLEKELKHRTGLEGRVGLAANKLISQVAAHSVACGDLCRIFPGGEPSFLVPLPVTSLPGVGAVTASRLSEFNISKVGQLAAIPPGHLSVIFGKSAVRLAEFARGIDTTPVVPFHEVPRLTLVRNLDRWEIDRERLEGVLFQEVENAAWLLRVHNRRPRRISLEVRYVDGSSARHALGLPGRVLFMDRPLFHLVRPLLARSMERRVAIRRLVLECSDFEQPFYQMPLFPWEDPSRKRGMALQMAVDRIRRRFGRNAVSWGRTVPVDALSRNPEDFPGSDKPFVSVFSSEC